MHPTDFFNIYLATILEIKKHIYIYIYMIFNSYYNWTQKKTKKNLQIFIHG